ncbi:hypothetical protein GGX14DRAFT_386815 [Mycena pura]|uniref:Uncharacterized protein n=1 Tax=Mycena pura TaxID=153505 RepID=A0AAD7E3C3_9AGAR|nr:hypothetical protein GGX14DRAFT_386815 [Mycena pura]
MPVVLEVLTLTQWTDGPAAAAAARELKIRLKLGRATDEERVLQLTNYTHRRGDVQIPAPHWHARKEKLDATSRFTRWRHQRKSHEAEKETWLPARARMRSDSADSSAGNQQNSHAEGEQNLSGELVARGSKACAGRARASEGRSKEREIRFRKQRLPVGRAVEARGPSAGVLRRLAGCREQVDGRKETDRHQYAIRGADRAARNTLGRSRTRTQSTYSGGKTRSNMSGFVELHIQN